MSGDHPRHRYVLHQLGATGHLIGWVAERREAFVPNPPEGLNAHDRALFVRHFALRDAAERRHFPTEALVTAEWPTHWVTPDTLNHAETIQWVERLRPDVLISYGVHKLHPALIATAPLGRAFNIHGGLSPWYRGTATLFWPFYLLQPNWAGMTLHLLSEAIDAGDIVHHAVPELMTGDGLHDVSCKAVRQIADELPLLLNRLAAGTLPPPKPQSLNGRLFKDRDWQPGMLRLIYDVYQDCIVDRWLAGELQSPDPTLIRAI